MKRFLLSISAILCINILFAQQGASFWLDSIQYEIDPVSQVDVSIYSSNNNITVANIPETVTYNGNTYNVISITRNAFQGRQNLVSVTIPNSVVIIGYGAFTGCQSLTTVTMSDNVASIGWGAFKSCSSLSSINIPTALTIIEQNLFQGCISLTSITIPDNIITIEWGAFWQCSNLESVTIGNGVTEIGWDVFSDCYALQSVVIPNSVTEIGNNAFMNCWALNSITIGENVSTIGNEAFMNCINLHTLNFNVINCADFNSIDNHPFKNAPIQTINIGENVQRIPAYFAYGFNQLSSVSLPNNLTEIGEQAFYGCSSLSSITIPNNITSIKDKTFQYCSNLTSVTLGSGLDSLGSSAFRNCSALENINCLASTPPTFKDNTVFAYPNSINVKVPCGSLDAYIADYYWCSFFTGRMTEDCESSLADIEEDNLTFYPNPATNRVTFSEMIERVELMDLTGKLIKSFENANEINIEGISSGVYFLKLQSSDKTIMRKLIKK